MKGTRDFWVNLPNRNRANYIFYEVIKYEDILDNDENGDVIAKVPHIYLDSIAARDEKIF